jgi:hypothetical protein
MQLVTARFLAAVHEAGHTAPWLAAGRRIQSARIDDDGIGHVRPLTRRASTDLYVRAALAGPAAEAHYLGARTLKVLAERDQHHDRETVLRCLAVPEIPLPLLAEVDALVVVHWRLIMTTAVRLATHGRLGFRQFEGLRRMYRMDRSPWL